MDIDDRPHDYSGDLLAQVESAADEAALEALRVAALGKKGAVSSFLKTLGAMPPEERKQKGPLINGLRDKVQAAIATRKDGLAEAALEARLAERLDVTLPVRKAETRGRIHPISQVIDELTAIFADMGFAIAEGPDIETDYYNFTALNFPIMPAQRCTTPSSSHPTATASARCCARTPRRCRSDEAQQPPIRVIIPGRTYRHDSDQTHTPCSTRSKGW